ncbi:MAG: redoxin family protein [Polyangiaceae bacterium]
MATPRSDLRQPADHAAGFESARRRRASLHRGALMDVIVARRFLYVLCIFSLGACASATPAAFSDSMLTRNGAPLTAHAAANGTSETVFVFYSNHCPCVAAHIERLRALQTRFAPENVRFWFVDSEVGATTARDTDLTKSRNLPFEMLIDADGKFARATGAEYASYTLVVDSEGRIRYHGGIDSDKSHLTGDAKLYLENALQDLASGRDVRVPEGKTLGCSLELP